MSVLERFVRVRRLRARAEEYYGLTSDAFSEDVRKRYLAIADHYAALADTELRSDRMERKRRLEEMSAARAKNAAADQLDRPGREPSRLPPPVRLRIIYSQKHGVG